MYAKGKRLNIPHTTFKSLSSRQLKSPSRVRHIAESGHNSGDIIYPGQSTFSKNPPSSPISYPPFVFQIKCMLC